MVARGPWQRDIERELRSGGAVPTNANAMLCGRARSYAGHYQHSLETLVARMRASGVNVVSQPVGPRGGMRYVVAP